MLCLCTSLVLWLNSLSPAAAPVPDAAEVSGKVDAALEAKWKALDLVPAAPADDAAFLRRVYLDLTGRVPPPLKAREFLDAKAPDKRDQLVEALLASEEFADYWAGGWVLRLTDRRPVKHDRYDGRVLHEYLRDSIQANKPYRQICEELICGQGLSDASGPANFLLRYEAKPPDLAGAVGKHFLGVTLQCAQCHDHPFATWKQDDFWGVAAFFARIHLMESNSDEGALTAVLESRRGELMRDDPTAKPDAEGKVAKKKVQPRFPQAKTSPEKGNRRSALAAWVTSDANPYFARHAVNVAWAHFFDAPLVPSLERPAAEGSGRHRQLLDLLAADFTASGHDIKRLVRIIIRSRAYQLGSADDPAETAPTDLRHRKLENFARFPVRPLTVDQLYQSIVQATGQKNNQEPNEEAKEENDGSEDVPLSLLGPRPYSVQRNLAMLNSGYTHKAVAAGARAAIVVNGQSVGPVHLEWLFLTTLSRRPGADESKALLQLVKIGKGKRGLEDVLWALLNSAEFVTNH